jgi:hypothetical protein
MTGVCALCGREEELTRHHLIPRMVVRRKRKDKAVTEPKKTIDTCRPCHSNMHALFTEKELGDKHNTVARLKKHKGIAKFSEWVAKRPAGFKPKKKARKKG